MAVSRCLFLSVGIDQWSDNLFHPHDPATDFDSTVIGLESSPAKDSADTQKAKDPDDRMVRHVPIKRIDRQDQ